MSDWVSEWQGHLLSCPGQLKRVNCVKKKLWNQFSLFFSSLENGSFQKKTSQFRLHCFIRKWKCPNKWETNFIFYVWSERNLRIGIYNREMVFNRLLGNGWPDLYDSFWHTSVKFRFWWNAKKISPLALLRTRTRKIRIITIKAGLTFERPKQAISSVITRHR